VDKAIDNLAVVGNPNGDIGVSQSLLRLLNTTEKLATDKGDSYLSTELFLLAIIKGNDTTTTLLKALGVDKQNLSTAIDNLRGGETVNDQNAETQREALNKYTLDLTQRAQDGKLDPVIGRDGEIRRAIQVLQRRTKNKINNYLLYLLPVFQWYLAILINFVKHLYRHLDCLPLPNYQWLYPH
jgi:ATP-dependent Clp protease ATP-binding subunit ClpB